MPEEDQKVLYDFVIYLGSKFDEEFFSESMKFYSYDFFQGKQKKVEIILESNTKGFVKMYIETIVAIYIRELIKLFQDKFEVGPNLIHSSKIVIAINNHVDHHYRYAVKEITNILGIHTQLIGSNHAKMLTYYVNKKSQ